MVVFDTSVLALAFDVSFKAPTDPNTGTLLTDCKTRIDNLIDNLSKKKVRILIPTPVLAEYLVRGGADKAKRLNEFSTSRAFTIAPFDQKAAIECALLSEQDMVRGTSSSGQELESKAKVKFDRQIIAIAKAQGVEVIYTGDINFAKCANKNGISTTMTWEIPFPLAAAQQTLEFTNSADASSDKSYSR